MPFKCGGMAGNSPPLQVEAPKSWRNCRRQISRAVGLGALQYGQAEFRSLGLTHKFSRGEAMYIEGSIGPDVLDGTSDADQIHGLEGGDLILSGVSVVR